MHQELNLKILWQDFLSHKSAKSKKNMMIENTENSFIIKDKNTTILNKSDRKSSRKLTEQQA